MELVDVLGVAGGAMLIRDVHRNAALATSHSCRYSDRDRSVSQERGSSLLAAMHNFSLGLMSPPNLA